MSDTHINEEQLKQKLIEEITKLLNNPNLHIDSVDVKTSKPRLGITGTREFDFLIQIQGLVIEEQKS